MDYSHPIGVIRITISKVEGRRIRDVVGAAAFFKGGLMEGEGSLPRAIFTEEVTTTVGEIVSQSLGPTGPTSDAATGLKIHPGQTREVVGRGPAIGPSVTQDGVATILAKMGSRETILRTAANCMAVTAAASICVGGLVATEGSKGPATKKVPKGPTVPTT